LKGKEMADIDPTLAIRYIQENAQGYAQAKADRVYLEEARKSRKAQLMRQSDESVLGKQEAEAYSHPQYLELLLGLKAAIEKEEHLRWMMEAAKLKVEVYKVQEYTKRTEIKHLG